jgi:hypothetical protein
MSAPAAPPITVRAGTADPVSMTLTPGDAVGPLSVGRDGTWRVVAPGVLEEHAFLYFNGTELFLQSADPMSPVTVNGASIPGDWTPVYAPCEIAFGGARLWFGPPGQAAASRPPPARSAPPPAPSVPRDSPSAVGRRPFGPRVQGLDNDDESTRLHPLEEMAVSRRPAHDATGATLKSSQGAPAAAPIPVSPPSFGAPSAGGAPSFGAPPSAAAPSFGAPPGGAPVMGPGPMFGAPPPGAPLMFPGPPVAPDGLPGVPPAAKKESWLGARWREASGPKKALMLLLVPLIWAVWVIFTDKPPPVKPQKPAASATTAPSTTPSAGAPPDGSAASAVEPAPPPPPSPPPSPSGKASASPSTTTREKTREREAADAVAAGAYDRAARLYDELAKGHPEVPAYAEAARIMKAKAGKR